MLRMLIVVVVVLVCSVATAAPPDIAPELVGWWDAWHDSKGRFLFPLERRASMPGTVIRNSHLKYELQSRQQLHAIMIDPDASLQAVAQADVILKHWGLWPRRACPSIVVP